MMKKPESIIEEVIQVIKNWKHYDAESGVSKKSTEMIQDVLKHIQVSNK